jgi:hypothetical protein
MKVVRLIKICLNETYSKVCISKHLSDTFPILKWSKTRRCFIAIVFNFVLEYAIRKVQENQVGLKLNGTHQLLIYIDDVNLLGNNTDTIKKNQETLIVASKEVDLKVNTEKTKYMLLSHHKESRAKP